MSEAIPRLENCDTYLARDNKGQWHYLNHANTWQSYQGPENVDPEVAQPARPDTSKETARQSGYTGDQCSNCFSMRMRVAGHCMVCEDCGTTTGCS